MTPGFPVPTQIPGVKVTDRQKLGMLKPHVSRLCQLPTTRFPGAQPVSFDITSLDLLEQEDFWVCEKSDGVRVLVLIVAPQDGPQEVYLIDRKEDYYQVEGLQFPHQDGPQFVHSNTILDGELVIDVDRGTGEQKLRLLAFDCLVIDNDNLMRKPPSSRYGRLKMWVIEPHEKFLKQYPEAAARQPFELKLKKMELAYGIEAVLRDHLPALEHGNDGLIFTGAQSPYNSGTDPKILKWKPPSENSIDFRLELRFPPLPENPDRPDYYTKPIFALYMNCGREGEQFYDEMAVDDETWERWKESQEQVDDRVVEVAWEKKSQNWRFMRFRDDKTEGNYKDVVAKIEQSIRDGVEADVLVRRAGRIKHAWKAREAKRNGTAPPSAQHSIPPVLHPARPPQDYQSQFVPSQPPVRQASTISGIKR